ncbi:MAG: general secretion pathway protein GspB [Candidatus Thiodiazotropha sp.]
MSLILEALKKAERQHKLGEVPKISPNTEQPATRGPHGTGWVMMALLALILLGVGIYLGSNSWFSPQAEVEAEVSRAETRPGNGMHKNDQPELAPVQSEAVIDKPDPPPADALARDGGESRQAIPTPREMEIEPSREREIETPPVALSESAPPPPPAKPLHEMPSGFVAHLPVMNIDIHSYDTRPAKRYVLINMEKYREGDYLAEGPRLVEILPQGAVMEHMGERFILPIGNQ